MENIKSPPPIVTARRTASSSSTTGSVAAPAVVPQRTTKTASKLVVFPPASPPLPPQPAPSTPITILNITKPPSASELSPNDLASSHPEYSSSMPEYSNISMGPPQPLPFEKPINTSGPRTEAESISKEFRVLLPRVTAYCAADAYDIKAISAFLKTKHGVVGRHYDECLYVSYEHRVAGGANGYAALMQRHTARVLGKILVSEFAWFVSTKFTVPPTHQSTLSALNLVDTLTSANPIISKLDPLTGRVALDTVVEDIATSIHPRHSQTSAPPATPIHPPNMPGMYVNFPETHLTDPHLASPLIVVDDPILPKDINVSSSPDPSDATPTESTIRRRSMAGRHGGSRENLSNMNQSQRVNQSAGASQASQLSGATAGAHAADKDYKWMGRNEVFLFDFGVIVLWNFTVEEENLYLSILRPFATNPRNSSDAEVEDFHFQYDFSRPNQPRIYNDMITLKSGNPMIKLTISHGISQSAKLARFENIMESEIAEMTILPKMMAKHGEVKLTRDDVMKIVGRLFRLRMDVNLVSNVLDTPEIFWSEPELQGLYNAIRGYLEISQRVKLLNTRTGVISDLLDMLSDHLHGSQMTMITKIVIFLIVITCIVAAAEVYVKMLLEGRGVKASS
ncbi:UNVERIFIED_CONTAM: hypothetical protein HDU68_004459 [Siphonaria sp. JEL0065]|nr:hypothetical protein HDU68_004459 [Siphonaria sp. JEL0065]